MTSHFLPMYNLMMLLGRQKRDGKRGRGATGKIPFVAAVSTNHLGHPDKMRFSQVKAFSKKCIKSWAAKHLSPNCTVVSDGLSCFTVLASAGHQHTAIITGGGPDSVKIPEFKWVNTVISNVKRSLNGTYHAISKNISRVILLNFATVLIGDIISIK